MRNKHLLILITVLTVGACSSNSKQLETIASIKARDINLEEPEGEIPIDEDTARKYYREFLSITTDYQMYSQALRRLADLQLKIGEKQLSGESEQALEKGQRDTQASIRLYTTYLESHPNHPNNDQILYQLAKAYELNGQPKKSLEVLDRTMHFYPNTSYRDEVQFRRGEMLFLLKRYKSAKQAYSDIIQHNQESLFYEKAMYKYGWTQFKTNRYKDALDSFFAIMDRKQQQGMLNMDGVADNLVGTERELIVDTLRAISLSFAYLHGEYTITQYFTQSGNRPYEPIIYLSLGRLHMEKERTKDAADTYMTYVQRYPASPLAPEFHTEAINAYQKGGLTSLVLPAKEKFVTLYGVGSAYWNQQNPEAHERIKPLLSKHITEIANHYHAIARKSKKSKDYLKAAGWYGIYIKNFPTGVKSAQMNFLKAEALYDGRYYIQAAVEFEKSAYQYPRHAKSAEAGYAAILSYTAIEKAQPKLFSMAKDTLINTSPAYAAILNEIAVGDSKPKQLDSIREKSISISLRFIEQFPNDKRIISVMAKTSDTLFKAKDYLRAASVAEKLTRKNIQDPKIARTAWTVLGHSQFELGNYQQAEAAYRESLRRTSNKDKNYRGIYDRLAASIYKQGEQARAQGKYAEAVAAFLRVKQVTPGSSLRANADYDAAATLIELKQFKRASQLLEQFRRDFPKHKLVNTIPEKLAVIYSETGQPGRAAREMERLAKLQAPKNKKYSADLLWQAGTFYEKARMSKDATRIYAQYIQLHPYPLERSMEARHKLAEQARLRGDSKTWGKWLQDIIRADARGGTQRTARTQFLAADATLKLAEGHHRVYQRARITRPIKQGIKRKKELMQNTIKAYETAIKYRVAEVTTAATYQIGELYRDFAKALMNAPAPKGLGGEALEQYRLLLEDQAFPIEEKSIGIHVANVKQIKDGIYDQWVKDSLKQLRKLLPARYAKDEKVQNYVEAIH
ncbi:MAG: tetratricopeptide repeat protein [Thioalkalispiraceae bacterium]